MPLVTATVIVYVAGLLGGFGSPLAWSVVVIGLVAWQMRGSRDDRVALLAIATAGYATASISQRRIESCADTMRGAREWVVTLAADASPGAFVPGVTPCGTTLRLAVERGASRSGAVIRVAGRASSARGGIVVEDAAITTLRAPSAVVRWRESLGQGLDRHFEADAPLVRALLLADMRDLSPTIRDRYASAGLSHMLSVSGLHVGIIAAAVSLLAQLVGMGRGWRDVAVIALTGAYVAVIGAPLPAVRAGVMLLAYSLGAAVQRPTSPWAVLAVGAAVPLLDPRAVLDVGYRLSVVGMVALIAAGALNRRWEWLKAGGWRGEIVRGVATSTIATLLTAPLVAATFGRVSLVAPLSNLVAIPIIAVLQPMLFLAAIGVAAGVGAQFLADAAHPLLVSLDTVASYAASLPGASIPVLPDPLTSAIACAAAAAFVVAAMTRFPGRALVTGAACLATLAWRPMLPARPGMTELHVIDVGQGDAIALRTGRGRWVLFDAGRDWIGGDEGKRDVIPYIASRGGSLVAFVLSHPHADHVGGAASTLHALKPAYYYDPGYAGGTTPYHASLLEAQRTHIAWRRVHPGDSLVVDEATIIFLAPDSSWADAQRDPNLASTVARIRIGEVSMLLTGDAEAPEERWLLQHAPGELRADVLKVAHHGSRTSSTTEFLDAVQPRLAVVSVGAGNVYHHPNAEVLQNLARHGAVTLRTDRSGSVIVRTNGRAIEVEAMGERWPLRP